MNKIITFICLSLALSVSCSKEVLPEIEFRPDESEETIEKISVGFVLSQPISRNEVKSSINPNENIIENLDLIVYSSGELFESHNFTHPGNTPSELRLYFNVGKTYNIYGLANCALDKIPLKEEDFLQLALKSKDSNITPMSWTYSDFTPEGEVKKPLEISLKRLVSKILLSFDSSNIPGFKVESARICQSAQVLRPFCYNTGSKVIQTSEVSNGDYASSSDIIRLNQGNPITFYTFENCQGILLPNNKDPWGKIPDNITDKGKLCTYLEVTGTFSAPSIHRGTATYRLFLGKNNLDDFNIEGNSLLSVSIIGTDKNFSKLSWKIESNTTLDPLTASSWISNQSMHTDGEFYVGERFEIGFNLSKELMTYLGAVPEETHIEFIPDTSSNKGKIRFGKISQSGNFEVIGTAMNEGEGSIHLVRNNGEHLIKLLDNIKVSLPEIKGRMNRNNTIYINDGNSQLDIYMTDKQGNDLSVNSLGFDYSLFSLDVGLEFNSDILKITRNPTKDGSYYISCSNPGTDPALNSKLAEIASSLKIFFIKLNEKNFKKQGITYAIISMPAIRIKPEYHDKSLVLAITNKSRIPLELDMYLLGLSRSYENDSRWQRAHNYVQSNLFISRHRIVAKGFDKAYCSNAIYGTRTSITCGIGNNFSPCTTDNDTKTYTINQLNMYDQEQAIIDDKCIPSDFIFKIDLRLNGYQIIDKLVTIGESLDLSAYAVKGISIYSNQKYIISNFTDNVSYMDPLSCKTITDPNNVIRLIYTMSNNPYSFTVKTQQESIQGVYFDFYLKGLLTGGANVVSKPRGKRAFKYVNINFEGVCKDLEVVAGMERPYDSGKLADALKKQHDTFLDDYKGKKHNFRRAYPQRLDSEVNIVVSEKESPKILNIECQRDKSFIHYHFEGNEYYDIPDKLDMPLMKYVEVKRK